MIEYRLLNGMEVRKDGQPVDVGGPKHQRLLAALLLANGVEVSIGRIGEMVWPKRRPKNLKGSIQVSVHHVRSSLDDDQHGSIETTAGGYRLLVDDSQVDFRVFERLINTGLQSLSDGAPAAAAQALDEAIGMSPERPLAELLDDGLAHPDIEYFAQRREAAQEGRLEARLALGLHRQVVAESRRLLADNPYNETLWANLMVALYRSNRRTEALRSYRIAVEHLAESGLEPTRFLQEFEERILAQDEGLLLKDPVPPTNLPEADVVLGHDAEVDAVLDQLRTNSVAVVDGTATSKATVIEAARRMQTTFPDGSWFLDATNRQGADRVVHLALDVLGVLRGADPRQALMDRIAGRSMLLIVSGADPDSEEMTWLRSTLHRMAPASGLLVAPPPEDSAAKSSVGDVGTHRPTANGQIKEGRSSDRLLARLSVFAGPVPLAAIRYVTSFAELKPGDVDYLLRELVADDRATVDNTGPEPRFSPATQQPPQMLAEHMTLVSRHTAYYSTEATEILDVLDGDGRGEALQRSSANHGEFEAAIGRSIDNSQLDEALHIGNAAGRFWSTQGAFLGQAVSILGSLSARVTIPSADAAGVVLSLGFAHFRSSAFANAASCYDRAIGIAVETENATLLGRAFVERAHLRMFLGDWPGASGDLDRARSHADAAGLYALLARVRLLRAQLQLRGERGVPGTNIGKDLDRAIAAYRDLGHRAGEANALLVKSSWHIDRNEPAESIEAAGMALDIAQIGGDRSMLAFALVRTAEASLLAGKTEKADAAALEAVAIAVEVGNWLVASLGLLAIGSSRFPDDPVEAMAATEAFVTLRDNLGVPLTFRELDLIEAQRVTLPVAEVSEVTLEEAKQLALRLARSAE